MKARTRYQNGCNRYEVYFTYEDWCGFRFKSYDELKRKGEKPFYIIGYLKSHYWGSNEPIDELVLSRRPTISQIKRFIKHCKDELKIECSYIQNSPEPTHEERMQYYRSCSRC